MTATQKRWPPTLPRPPEGSTLARARRSPEAAGQILAMLRAGRLPRPPAPATLGTSPCVGFHAPERGPVYRTHHRRLSGRWCLRHSCESLVIHRLPTHAHGKALWITRREIHPKVFLLHSRWIAFPLLTGPHL